MLNRYESEVKGFLPLIVILTTRNCKKYNTYIEFACAEVKHTDKIGMFDWHTMCFYILIGRHMLPNSI